MTRPVAVFFAVWLAVGAAAADRVERGTVVRIEAGEVYFDVPRARGAGQGRAVRFKRPVRLTHPVTGETISDELPLGALSIRFAGAQMSMAVLDADLVDPLEIGDVAEVRVPGAAASTEPAGEETSLGPEAAAVMEVFRQAAGRRLVERLALWQRYLETHPGSPYEAGVRRHVEELEALRRRAAEAQGARGERTVDGVEHHRPRRVVAGDELGLAFLWPGRDAFLAGWLHYRAEGAETFRRVPLTPDGDAYLRASIPAGEIQAPGVEYFLEIADHRGDVGVAVGSPHAPVHVEVESTAPPLFEETRHRSRVTLRASYVDFATFDDRDGDRTDRFFVWEADFLYRLRAAWLHGIRTGFGSLNGQGGFRDETSAPEQGFHYGYVEVETRASEKVAVLARLVSGLASDGIGFGVEGRLRLGPEEGTNLLFEAANLPSIGFLSGVRMQWRVMERMPLGFGVAVTDRPSRGDLGLRLSADWGIRLADWVEPTVTVSFQGRSVEHAGVGAGLGLVFDW